MNNDRSTRFAAIVVSVVLAICAGTIGWARSIAKEHEPRIRRLEEQSARIDERLKAVITILEEIRADIRNNKP